MHSPPCIALQRLRRSEGINFECYQSSSASAEPLQVLRVHNAELGLALAELASQPSRKRWDYMLRAACA